MTPLLTITLSGLAAQPAPSGLAASVTIPRLDVAEYHRPYAAIWVQTPRGEPVLDLAVWYDTEMRDDEGETWLKDLRQWWRRIGRSAELPIDGVTGPTRAPGEHRVAAPAPELPGGEYVLMVEAAREVGGREVVSIPFAWPVTEPTELSESGSSELGRVSLTLTPQE